MKTGLKQANIKLLHTKIKKLKNLFAIIASDALKDGVINNEREVIKSFLKREKQGSTGMENNIAIPHAFSEAILVPTIYIYILNKSIKWETMDNDHQVAYVVALLVPKNKRHNQHLKMLSEIAMKLMEPTNIAILQSKNLAKIYEAFK